MGLTANIAYYILSIKDLISVPKDGRFLSIGTIDFWLNRNDIRKLGITTIIAEEADKIYELKGQAYFDLSKRLMSQFFELFGYTEYVELDINERADLFHDLNIPVSRDTHERFDLVWDAGSIEHIMNVNQALVNMIAMTKMGGKIIHFQAIGDQTNAGYWTFSPNFFKDFYEAHGFRIDVIKLIDRRRHAIPYNEIITKSSSVGSLIPLRYLPSYYLRMIRSHFLQRIIRYPQFYYAFRSPALLGQLLQNRGVRYLGKILRKLQIPFNWIIGLAPTSGYDWGILVVATRVKKLKTIRYPIQNVYRSIFSEKHKKMHYIENNEAIKNCLDKASHFTW